MFIGSHVAWELIALAIGYKVFVEANKEGKKAHKQLGRLIGIFVMIVSSAAVVCALLKCAYMACPSGSKYCPIPAKVCPFSKK